MVSKLPEDQLLDLCTGHGATMEKIKTQAPFMEELLATQHALRVLATTGVIDWSEAARALLICVVKPNGAANFDEDASRFVTACLGLDGSVFSLTQRLHYLVGNSDGKYPRTPVALRKRRRDAMESLAATLRTLKDYPCAWPRAIERAIDEAAAHVEIVKSHHLEHLTEYEQADFYSQLFKKLTGSTAVFRQVGLMLTFEQQFTMMVESIADGAYRRLYEELQPQSDDILIPPQLVPGMYKGALELFDSESPEAELTARVIYRIMLDIEDRGFWEATLFNSDRTESSEYLFAQQRRIRGYFESLRWPL